MSENKYFANTCWIDLTHDNAPVPYAETVSWEGCPHGFGHYTELSVCVRNNDTQHHIIAVVAKRYLEPFRFDAKGLMPEPVMILTARAITVRLRRKSVLTEKTCIPQFMSVGERRLA